MKLLLLLIGFYTLGCATALQERCEKTNWFEHSRDVALDGRYLEEDLLIKRCKDIDITNSTQLDQGFKSGREKYCTYEGFLRRGEAGDVVNFKMCDELIFKQMQERYGQGLARFCTPDVGFTYGVSGKVYKNVCFKEQEHTFLPRYFQGRTEFLKKSIVQTLADMDALNVLQNQIEPQIALLTGEIRSLPSPQECSSVAVYNEQSKKDESKTICQESNYIRSRRSELYSDVNQLRRQFSNHAEVISNSIDNLQKLRTELTQLP